MTDRTGKPTVVHGHSTSAGGMNRPPYVEQRLQGVNLLGDEPEQKRLIDDEAIVLGKTYHDRKEDIDITPVRFYGDRVQISDGRSCTIEYAERYWSLVI